MPHCATFDPPFCPNAECARHAEPGGRFWRRHGRFRVSCRSALEQRYRCVSCRRTFSRQTFRHDRGDRRPDVNVRVFEMVASGVGLRQTARIVRLDVHSLRKKVRKIARTCGALHANSCSSLPSGRTYLLAELETCESTPIRALTVATCIERETWFVVDVAAAPIRRLAKRGSRRRRRQEREEARVGKRRDAGRECVRGILERLAALSPTGVLELRTTGRSSYRTITRSVFGCRAVHEPSTAKTTHGPHDALFPIRNTIQTMRCVHSRLRRNSWLASKSLAWLRLHLRIFVVYRNYVRRRFHHDAPTDCPARLLGLIPRALRTDEVLSWRQDWGRRSPHPSSFSGRPLVSHFGV